VSSSSNTSSSVSLADSPLGPRPPLTHQRSQKELFAEELQHQPAFKRDSLSAFGLAAMPLAISVVRRSSDRAVISFSESVCFLFCFFRFLQLLPFGYGQRTIVVEASATAREARRIVIQATGLRSLLRGVQCELGFLTAVRPFDNKDSKLVDMLEVQKMIADNTPVALQLFIGKRDVKLATARTLAVSTASAERANAQAKKYMTMTRSSSGSDASAIPLRVRDEPVSPIAAGQAAAVAAAVAADRASPRSYEHSPRSSRSPTRLARARSPTRATRSPARSTRSPARSTRSPARSARSPARASKSPGRNRQVAEPRQVAWRPRQVAGPWQVSRSLAALAQSLAALAAGVAARHRHFAAAHRHRRLERRRRRRRRRRWCAVVGARRRGQVAAVAASRAPH
jgi:hypothetical protein